MRDTRFLLAAMLCLLVAGFFAMTTLVFPRDITPNSLQEVTA